jgi:hypothetical protein
MEDFKELQNLRFGESSVLIEFCANCSEHNGSLRHDENKYFQKALEIKNAIQTEFPFFKIFMKPLRTADKTNVKRLGLLEVYLATYDLKGPRLISSKLKTLVWPEIRVIVNNIRSYFEGKDLYIKLDLPSQHRVHPQNNLAANIRTVLVSYYDLSIFQEKMSSRQHNDNSFLNKTQTSFKKQRNVSAIVERKIKSGILKEDEINALVSSKEFLFAKNVNNDFTTKFDNVKPGKYKFIVLENENFEASYYDIFVEPRLRDKNAFHEYNFLLLGKETCNLNLTIEGLHSNPVYKLVYQPIDFNESENSIESQNEEEFPNVKKTHKDDKEIYSYKLVDVLPGVYKIHLEYKDYEVISKEIELYAGFNAYYVKYPELTFTFANTAEAGVQQMQLIDNKHLKSSQEANGHKHFMSPISENPRAENQSVQNSNTTSRLYKDSSKDNQKASKKLSFTDSFDEGDKENLTENDSNKSNHMNRQNSKVDKGSYVAKKSVEMDKESKQFEEDKMAEKSNFTKQRVTSGNRVRPGERLYSAKSRNNHQLHEDTPKLKPYILEDVKMSKSDPLFKICRPNLYNHCLNIFLKTNSTFKLEFALHVNHDGTDEENEMYEEFVLDEGYEQYILTENQNLNFGRVFVEKVSNSLEEDVDICIIDNKNAYKIPLSEYWKQMCLDNENFIDLGLVMNNVKEREFEFLLMIVPMSIPINCSTGVSEIKSIVNFMKHSKYQVWKFFGFEIEEDQEGKDYTITAEEAIENLKSYEVSCSNPYIINAIRVNKKGTLSLKKLEEVYKNWQKFAQLIDKYQIEFPDESNQGEENGEAIEFSEEEIYNDDEDEYQEEQEANDDEFDQVQSSKNENFDN